MVYQANIPQPPDIQSNSQNDILDNFQAIYNLVGENHYNFNSGDDGKHIQVELPVQSSLPLTDPGEVSVFSLTSTLTTVPELCIRRQSNGVVYQMTSAAQTATGWTYLPSGILLKWGQVNATGSTNIVFPAGVNIPAFTSILSIMLTTYDPAVTDTNTFVRLAAFSAPWTQFSVYASNRTTATPALTNFQYLAIGI